MNGAVGLFAFFAVAHIVIRGFEDDVFMGIARAVSNKGGQSLAVAKGSIDLLGGYFFLAEGVIQSLIMLLAVNP
jgi:hypothetical protein